MVFNGLITAGCLRCLGEFFCLFVFSILDKFALLVKHTCCYAVGKFIVTGFFFHLTISIPNFVNLGS